MKNRILTPALIAFLLVGVASYCAVKFSKPSRVPANDAAAVAVSPGKVKEAKPAQSLPAETKKIVVKSPDPMPVQIAKAEPTPVPAPPQEPIAEPAVLKPSEPQIDLTEEISAVGKTKEVSAPAELAPEGTPEGALTLETETTVNITTPEPAPEEVKPEVADAPAPSLGAPEPPKEEEPLDQLTFSPELGFHAVKTNRASNGQGLQLATKLSPGFRIGVQQSWTKDFNTYGTLGYRSYTFEQISGVNAESMSGSAYSGILGADWKQADRFAVGLFAGMGQSFAVNVTPANALEPVKYTRPEAGVKLKADLVKTEKAALSLIPKAAYIFGGTHASDKSKGHLEYGIKLGVEKRAHKIFSSTGAEIDFTRSKFDSSQGKTANTSLKLNLNFSFGF